MSESWHSLHNINDSTSDSITTEAIATADSLWFSGHFPGDPILPGVAELSMVFDTIKQYEQKNGKNIRLSGMKKVRFRLLVKPNDTLSITISPDKKNSMSYSFSVKVKDETACSGIILTEQIQE